MFKFKIEKLQNHPFNFKYNVKVINNGFYYGIGKFCNSKKEVQEFIKNYNEV